MISLDGLVLLGRQSWLAQTLYTLLTWLDYLVYTLVSKLFTIFMIIARIDIFGTSSETQEMYTGFVNRIYTILWVAMIFVVGYFLLMKIINPDAEAKGLNSKKFVQDVLFSILGIILFPTIMGYLFTFQNHVLDDNTIAKIIFDVGFEGEETTDRLVNGEQGGTITGVLIYSALVYPEYTEPAQGLMGSYNGDNPGKGKGNIRLPDLVETKYNNSDQPITKKVCGKAWESESLIHFEVDLGIAGDYEVGHGGHVTQSCVSFTVPKQSSYIFPKENLPEGCNDACANYAAIMSIWYNTGNAEVLTSPMFRSWLNDDDGIHYWALFTLACGLWAAWCLLSYAFDMAKRCIKLAFLEIIAPIAFGLRLTPQGRQAVYPIWSRELIKTYLQVFMQMFFLYFTIYLITFVPGVLSAFFDAPKNAGYDGVVRVFAEIMLIIGLLAFLMEAPKLIKSLFPTDNMNLGGINFMPNKAWKGSVGQAAKPIGAVGGMALGASAGAVAGFKNFSKAYKSGDFKSPDGHNKLYSGLRHVGAGAKYGLRGAWAGGKAGLKNDGMTPKKFSEAMTGSINAAQQSMDRLVDKNNAKAARFEKGGGNKAKYYAEGLRDAVGSATGVAAVAKAFSAAGGGKNDVQTTFNITNNINETMNNTMSMHENAAKDAKALSGELQSQLRNGNLSLAHVQQWVQAAKANPNSREAGIINDIALMQMDQEGKSVYMDAQGGVYASTQDLVAANSSAINQKVGEKLVAAGITSTSDPRYSQAAAQFKSEVEHDLIASATKTSASAAASTRAQQLYDQATRGRNVSEEEAQKIRRNAENQAKSEIAQFKAGDYKTAEGLKSLGEAMSIYKAAETKDMIQYHEKQQASEAQVKQIRNANGSFTDAGKDRAKELSTIRKNIDVMNFDKAVSTDLGKESLQKIQDALVSAGLGDANTSAQDNISNWLRTMSDEQLYSSLTSSQAQGSEMILDELSKFNKIVNASAQKDYVDMSSLGPAKKETTTATNDGGKK